MYSDTMFREFHSYQSVWSPVDQLLETLPPIKLLGSPCSCVHGPQLAILFKAPQRGRVPSVVWRVEDVVMEVDVAPRGTGKGKERSSRHLMASLTITSLGYLSVRLSLRAALTAPRRRARRPGRRQCSTVQFPARPPARAPFPSGFVLVRQRRRRRPLLMKRCRLPLQLMMRMVAEADD